MKMKQKHKSRVFDFIMTLGTLEFFYYVIMIELFDYKPKLLQKKIERFLDEKRS
jgi:uncharacterized membrane protein (DUF485 family)